MTTRLWQWFNTAILCMEMRRLMIVKEHLNDDTVEPTDLRHLFRAGSEILVQETYHSP